VEEGRGDESKGRRKGRKEVEMMGDVEKKEEKRIGRKQ